MLTFFKTLYFFAIGFISLIVVCEIVISKLNAKNRFRKWWRKNIIAEYND
jgi:hypothetical protein